MDILPAIDLLNGRCVRLIQGRYDRVIEYDDDPATVAKRFVDAGATWTHVIDLDGARHGKVSNLKALESIVATGLTVQFGGGIRDEQCVANALSHGASRVIIGTRALEDQEWFKTLVHRPESANRIALGLDARLGRLAIRGWTTETQQSAVAVAETCSGWPLSSIVYTDIARDGMMLGPNLDATRALTQSTEIPIIYSGGITDLEDVRQLAEIKLAGIVIGRALYEGMIELRDAIAFVRG
jgi:phosphoribosylformimino-5-aminoimidazole carboxamide ribotide isomerase